MHVGFASGFQHQAGPEVNDTKFIKEDLDTALLADELGFDSVWCTEHHFSNYSLSPAPLQTLAYLAGRLKRARVGTQVIVLPWNDPVRVAEQIIWLDNITGGRMIVGLGRGLGKMEYDGLRVDMNQTRQLFREYSELLIQALETGFIEGGAITKQPRREIRPRPDYSFVGRMFGSAGSPESVRTVAELGLGVLIINPEPRADLGVDWASYETQWNQNQSRPVPRPLLSGNVFVHEDGDRAKEMSRDYQRGLFRASVKNYGMDEPDFGSAKGNEFYKSMKIDPNKIDEVGDRLSSIMPAGTPAEVLEKLHVLYKTTGLQGYLPHFHFGTMPRAEAVRNLRLFAKECLPEIHSWPVESSIDSLISRNAA